MIEPDDNRLPDWAYNETEMDQMALEVLEIDRYSEEPTNVVFYHLLKYGNKTGLVMILAVKSVIDGQEAIDRLWVEAGITAIVGEYNEESVLNQQRVEAIYLLIQHYKYEGKLKLPGANKVFVYAEWMGNLIKN